MEKGQLRTKHFIAASLKQMIKSKSLKQITVHDIVQYCKINRGTFYYYFKDKQDLINWIFHSEVSLPVRNMMTDFSKSEDATRLIFQLVAESADFYRQAIDITGQNSLEDFIFEETLHNFQAAAQLYSLEKNISRLKSSEMVEKLVLFHAQTNAFHLVKWIRDVMTKRPEEMAYMVIQSSNSSVPATIDQHNL